MNEQYQNVKQFLHNEDHALNDDNSQKIGQMILNHSPKFVRDVNHDPDAVAGTSTFKLETRADALTDLKDDYLNNADISEENNRGFRRSIRHIENDRHPVYFFCGGSDVYRPASSDDIVTYLLYLDYRAKRELLGHTDFMLMEFFQSLEDEY